MMLTDRELLEAAAKAYWGDEIDDVCSVRWLEDDQAIGFTHGDNQDHNGQDRQFGWNPLIDDGDALRLAVKLGIHVSPMIAIWWEQDGTEHKFENDASDPQHDTRRAIVRAAAAMAKP
jgi:hypothetical protein